MALTGSDNAAKIWNYFKNKGMSDEVVAGILGNIKQESGCNPKNLQGTGNKKLGMTDDEYTKAVDNNSYTNFVRDSHGYGLVQHTYHTRKQALLDYARKKGKSIGDLEMQLDFIYNEELSKKYKTVLAELLKARTVREASDIFMLKFEKPADQSEKAKAKRASYGETYYKMYTASTEPTSILNMDLRKKVVEYVEKYLGIKEGGDVHKFIIDTYNSVTPLSRSYKVKYTDSWCATFVSFISIVLGLTDIIPRECSCQRMIEAFKKIDSWMEADDYVPNIGDIVFYDWQDSGVGENTDWSDHVGFITGVNSNNLVAVEGNYSNSVKRRTLKVNGKYIRGYGIPNYGLSKATGEPVIDNPYFREKSYLTKTTDDLNLRSSASSSSKANIIAVIPKDRYVYVTDDPGTKWVRVQVVMQGDNYVGYVSKKYLEVVDISNNEQREVTAGGLNARVDRSSACPKVFTMNKGDVFTVITHSTWGLILYKNKIAYANITDAYSKKV